MNKTRGQKSHATVPLRLSHDHILYLFPPQVPSVRVSVSGSGEAEATHGNQSPVQMKVEMAY
jgi:hypothetical protein